MCTGVAKHSLFGFLLNVVSWARVIAQVDHSSKSVQAIPNGDIEGLTENPVSLLGVSYDLSIAPRNVEDDRVLSTSDLPTHFDV
jgi:hypothetical protein